MKNLVKPFIVLCLGICISSIFSCGNSCREDYTFYNDYYLSFIVIDKNTGENLLEIGVNRYYRDTVEIYNENLEPLGNHPSLNGSLGLYYLEDTRDDNEPLHKPIEHTYYVYFEEGDYDTLRMTYQIGLDQCSDKILTQWATYYNDSLYFTFPSNPPDAKSVSFVKRNSNKSKNK